MQYINDNNSEERYNSTSTCSLVTTKASKLLGLTTDEGGGYMSSVMGDFKSGPKNIYAGLTIAQKTSLALEQVRNKIVQEDLAMHRYHRDRSLNVDELEDDPMSPNYDAEY